MVLCFLILVFASDPDDQDKKTVRLSFSEFAVDEYLSELSTIMSNPVICKELEIVPAQSKKIRKRVAESSAKFQREFNSIYQRLTNGGDQKTFTADLQKLTKEHAGRITKILNDELLPHQIKNTDRLVYWSMIRSHQQAGRFGEFKFQSRFQDEAIKKILKIDAKQSAKIEIKRNALEGDFLQELAELHDKYDKLLAKELREEQKQLNKRILGKTPAFLFQNKHATQLPQGSKQSGGFF